MAFILGLHLEIIFSHHRIEDHFSFNFHFFLSSLLFCIPKTFTTSQQTSHTRIDRQIAIRKSTKGKRLYLHDLSLYSITRSWFLWTSFLFHLSFIFILLVTLQLSISYHYWFSDSISHCNSLISYNYSGNFLFICRDITFYNLTNFFFFWIIINWEIFYIFWPIFSYLFRILTILFLVCSLFRVLFSIVSLINLFISYQ